MSQITTYLKAKDLSTGTTSGTLYEINNLLSFINIVSEAFFSLYYI